MQTILIGATALYVLWLMYLAIMSLIRAYEAGTLSKPAFALGLPALAVGYTLDVLVNAVVFTALFAELPREWTVTARLQRHAKEGGWRGKVSSWIGEHLLDTFDPDGKHV